MSYHENRRTSHQPKEVAICPIPNISDVVGTIVSRNRKQNDAGFWEHSMQVVLRESSPVTQDASFADKYVGQKITVYSVRSPEDLESPFGDIKPGKDFRGYVVHLGQGVPEDTFALFPKPREDG